MLPRLLLLLLLQDRRAWRSPLRRGLRDTCMPICTCMGTSAHVTRPTATACTKPCAKRIASAARPPPSLSSAQTTHTQLYLGQRRALHAQLSAPHTALACPVQSKSCATRHTQRLLVQSRANHAPHTALTCPGRSRSRMQLLRLGAGRITDSHCSPSAELAHAWPLLAQS